MTRTASKVRLSAALAAARVRLLHMRRYPGQLLMETVTPVVLATMPILLGRSAGGADAASNFAAHTGSANYVAYLFIGSAVFVMVTRAFWDIAYWLRHEQETGTLEALALTPTGVLTLGTGVALASALRGLVAGSVSYLVGCLAFRIDPLQGDLLLAFAFVLVGLVPLYAMAFLFGALVLRFKEANRLVSLMQWGVSFLVGVFFPVTMLPPLLRSLALFFPPTWMARGVRGALLGAGFFFERWYLDMAVLWAFLVVTPLLSRWVFEQTERRIRTGAGLGEF